MNLIYFIVMLLICINCESGFFRNVNANQSDSVPANGIIDQETDGNKYSFIFNGLQKYDSVPVRFPKDICLMKVLNTTYAAALHSDGEGGIYFVVFKYVLRKYTQIYVQTTPLAISMDCTEFNAKGYIALAYNLTTKPEILKNGSPIYELEDEQIEIAQYFAEPHLTSVQFNVRGDSLFLLQTQKMQNNRSEMKSSCPIYKHEGTHFDLINRIPCKHSKRVALFTINSKTFIAVANYADEYNRTDTESHIYKYDIEENTFKLFQKIETYAVVDVDYFHVHESHETHHFLVFANSKQKGTSIEEDSSEAYSVIYKFENDNFVPFQKLLLYEVQQFLQVQSGKGEFILLVACDDQDVKLFQYNGWKFEESAIQLTDGALSKGISNMRYFDDASDTFIIVANENMLMNEPNVFIPIYKKFENISDIKMNLLDWSQDVVQNLSAVNVTKLKDDLKNIKQPAESVYDGTKFIKFKAANIDELWVQKLIYPPKNLTNAFWSKIAKAKNLIDSIKQKLGELNNIIESKYSKSDAQKNLLQNIATKTEKQWSKLKQYDQLFIKNLVVKSTINADNINGYSSRTTNKPIKLNEINATNIIVQNSTALSSSSVTNSNTQNERSDNETKSEFSQQHFVNLVVKKLNVTGDINELNLNFLHSNLLKTNGNQIISAPIKVLNLTANSVTTSDGLINNRNPTKLVQIAAQKSFVINQDIQFAAPIQAKNVNIKERINNIHIMDDRLDVLLNKANETQKITGLKIFNEVELMETIHLGGKIVGSQVNKVSPFNTIHENINLIGNYTITGDVSVSKSLKTDDISGTITDKSLKNVIDGGLKLSEPKIAQKLFFKALKSKNAYMRKVNDINAEKLLNTHIDRLQTITGTKKFTRDLNIDGETDIQSINRLDIDLLEKNMLNSLEDQNITQTIFIENLIVPSVTSENIYLGNASLMEVIDFDSEQIITGASKIKRLFVKNFRIKKLLTNNSIFGESSDHFKMSSNMQNSTSIENLLLFNITKDIKIKNLKLKTSLNQISIHLIEELMEKLSKEISLIGPIDFRNQMEILKLHFTNDLLGISKNDFGKLWLVKGAPQKFLAPQHFEHIHCDAIKLSGNLNKIPLQDFDTNTYWLDRNEYINDLRFESVEAKEIKLHMLNDHQFPNMFLISNSSTNQIIKKNVLADNVDVRGQLKFDQLNNFNFRDYSKFALNGSENVAVEYGIFDQNPTFEYVSKNKIKDLLKNIWLKDSKDTVLAKSITFNNVEVRNGISFENYVNNVNLSYVQDHFVSKTRPQKLSTIVKFFNEIIFKDRLSISAIDLHGNITNPQDDSYTTFNLTNFANNALQDEIQTVIGQWNIREVFVEGDLSSASLNGLQLKDDVMRYDSRMNNITSKKYFKKLKIGRIYTDKRATMNQLDISNWIHNTVFVYDNFTIHGHTIIDKSILYNNIFVDGSVNTIRFDEQAVLLKSRNQHLKSTNLRIVTKDLDKQEILSNTFEYLTAETVNGRYVDKLLKNINQDKENVTINGDLIFQNDLNVDDFDGNDYFFDLNTKQYFAQLSANSLETKIEQKLSNLNERINKIIKNYENEAFYFQKFEHLQTIYGNVKKAIPWTVSFGYQILDYLVILSGQNDDFKLFFYAWNPELNLFVLDSKITWLSIPQYHKINDIDKIWINGQKFLVIETLFEDEFYQHFIVFNEGLLSLHKIKNNSSRILLEKTDNVQDTDADNCFHLYSPDSSILSKLCLNEDYFKTVWNYHLPHVTQVLQIDNTHFATLKSNSIEIRDFVRAEVLQQRLVVLNPIHMTSIKYNNQIYLAVVCSKRQSSLYSGSVEIYRSTSKSYFERFQTLPVISPLIAKFQIIPHSNDLLFYALTSHLSHSLAVYHYKGVGKFQQIIEKSSIQLGLSFDILSLDENQKVMIAVENREELNLVELIMKKV